MYSRAVREGTGDGRKRSMPAIYCVTGATGFIGGHLVAALLRSGHRVRATVRDPGDESRVSYLRSFEGADERLEIWKADLKVEGSFDRAMDGADGVFHVASLDPRGKYDNIQEQFIDPIVNGVRNVLTACARARLVRRAVLTSSCACVRYRDDVTQVSPLNESHWSDLGYCKRYQLWYPYAKTLAEKEAWRLAADLGVYLVVVNPSYVMGPVLSPQPTSTMKMLLDMVLGHRTEYPNRYVGFVHIDDVVRCHIFAMEDARVSGRVVCSGAALHFSELILTIKSKYPQYPVTLKCGDNQGENIPHEMDTTKLHALGFPPFAALGEIVDDSLKSLRDRGFL